MRKKKLTVPFIRHYSGTYAYYIRVRRRKILRHLYRTVLILFLLALGYFFMKTLLNVSMLPPIS